MAEPRSSYRSGPKPPPRGSSTKLAYDAMALGGGAGSNLSTDEEQTVISTRTPSDLPETRQLHPVEIGRLLEGEQLGQFVLQNFVGGGGMGAVFRAIDTTLNREVAVKVLSRDQSGDEETLRRFKNEAQSAARLDHDNIARVYYVGEDRGVHYIVFEFIEGVNIRDLVHERGPLPLDETISYTWQVSEALAHASHRDVIHRDIKPSNVLITPDGKAKLVDMGLARLHQVEHEDNDLTASGVTLGTFDYISPEQARDPRSADVRSDLYSLGCSWYYMLTGRPPFPEGTVLQKLLQHQGDTPPDARQTRPELPVEVSRMLNKLLAKNPNQRYQTPGELIHDLLSLGDTIGMPPLASASVNRVVPAPSPAAVWWPHLPWVVPLAALLAIVLTLHFLWADSGPSLPSDLKPISLPARAKVNGAAAGKSNSGKSADAQAGSAAATKAGDKKQNPPIAPAADTATNEPMPAKNADGANEKPEDGATDVASGAEPKAAPVAGTDSDEPSADPSKAVVEAGPNDHLLIVSDRDEGINSYTTLSAACSAAHDGDTIELHFNGRHDEHSISLANLNLTIRAGEHFHPLIAFRPADPVKDARSMIVVVGGQLRLIGVNLELDIPHEAVRSDSWALVETRQADLVRLEHCTLTIRNAAAGLATYQPGVAFFDVTAMPGSDVIPMDPTATAALTLDDELVTIELQDCIARGEATLLRTDEMQSVKFRWNNGLLATTERLLIAAGGASQPRFNGSTDLQLRHMTAVVRSGFALLAASEEAPYQLPTTITCADSIIVGSPVAPLIEQKGIDRIEDQRARLSWRGDHNFYDGFDVFWKLANPAMPDEAKQDGFAAWKAHWGQEREHAPSRDSVAWANPPGLERLLQNHTAGDYLLTDDNPAREGASDGQDAGCLVDQLPELPADNVPTTKTSARGVR